MGIQNLGNSAIQILEGTGVAAEQALGTGARLVTGAAETAAEAAETGARSAIRIANVSLPIMMMMKQRGKSLLFKSNMH